MRNFIFICIACILGFQVQAQRKLHVGLEYKYMTQVKVTAPSSVYIADRTTGRGIRTYLGYNITPNYNVNLGFGADGYTGNGTFTIPLVLNARYYLNEKQNSPFVSIEGGPQLRLAQTTDKGYLFGACIGYRFKLIKKTCINIHAGYNFQQGIDEDGIVVENINRQSLLMGFGINF